MDSGVIRFARAASTGLLRVAPDYTAKLKLIQFTRKLDLRTERWPHTRAPRCSGSRKGQWTTR